MAPEIQATAYTTQAWLQSSWNIQVPFAWLEACVEWLQGEAAGATGRLSQQQINQQALDQWLLADLRDLDYPVLPEGLAQAQKTELSGTFCVQVDSLLDVSQPAYSQLQKWRGTDCANDDVSAVTQATQKPWEARPTRMLLLQVTDGVQSLEAMEYLPIPALSSALRPGTKLQLQGQMVCRLGVLLLGPSNIKILGGEVEDLVDRNHQGRVLCRTLGLSEEQQQQEGEEATRAPQRGNQEVDDMESDLELEDADLLASLEAQEAMEGAEVGPGQDSGYRTLGESSTQSSGNPFFGSLVSAASSRSEASAHFYTSDLTQSSRGDSVHNNRNAPRLDHLPSEHVIQQDIQQDHSMAGDDFRDEDFDDLPLDELESVIYQESTNVVMQSSSSHTGTSKNDITISGNPNSLNRTGKLVQHSSNGFGSSSESRSTAQKRNYQGFTRGSTGSSEMATSTPFFSPSASEQSLDLKFVTDDGRDYMNDDTEEVETFVVQNRRSGGPNQLPVQQGSRRDREGSTNTAETSVSSYRVTSESVRNETEGFSVKTVNSHNTLHGQSCSSNTRESVRPSDSTVPLVTLTSPPFTYLCLLEELMSNPQPHTTEIQIKAFIVTLLGKLSSSNGIWCVCATISDGTGYLDVKLSDEVLTSLLGFSVAEKAALKRDPARKGELDVGMRRCQEELVDMCCVMTIVVEPEDKKAVVTKADPVSEKVLQELEQRVRDRRK
ncbi:hypothetical protein Q5P01_014392 [Channa striata]|uniref:RecQ-mediated genome instability protein 1 n=1 Tax=Channa striata TaxID=64152 RepID=A0AA88MH50_CHASR|nr:hypothetical protein Q5P01_014392 [Channa striata]